MKETSSEFTANKLIRQAVAHCIDNEGIVEGLMGGHAGVPDSIYSEAVCLSVLRRARPCYYDLAAAAQKLEEAGYPNGRSAGIQRRGRGRFLSEHEGIHGVHHGAVRAGRHQMKLEIKEAAAWQDAYSA